MAQKGETWPGPRCFKDRHELPEGGRCKKCQRESYVRCFSGSHGKEVRRRHKLKLRFGISIEEYNRMWASQGNACAACGTQEPDLGGRNFPVDHNHATGQIRAILCFTCNASIGSANEDADFLRHLALYLDLHE